MTGPNDGMAKNPEELSLKVSGKISMEFRLLPAGTFRMGARGESRYEEPIHEVTISRPFYMGIYPVTQEQFAVWTTECNVKHENRFPNKSKHPAESMDWQQAVDFCEWLNRVKAAGIPSGWRAGLPSEAEWEYACRLMKDKETKEMYSVDTEYYSGDGEAALDKVGWYSGNAGSMTHPVGEKEGTSFGLYDLHGNVWEWCRDFWNMDAYKLRGVDERDPEERDGENARRVVRGGSWYVSAGDCRAAYRNSWLSRYRDRSRGFRVCLFSGPSSCQ